MPRLFFRLSAMAMIVFLITVTGQFGVSALESRVQSASGVATPSALMVAPPRSISDITSILDQQKPDVEKIAKLTAEANASPPTGINRSALAEFYYKRAQSRATIGRIKESLVDAELAIESAQGVADYVTVISRYEQFLGNRFFETEDFNRMNELLSRQKTVLSQSRRSRLFNLNIMQIKLFLRIGDINRAEALVVENRKLLDEARGWPDFSLYAAVFQGNVESGNAFVADARGLYADAEEAFLPRSPNVIGMRTN
jgi:hypothetical protein